ncbi:nuclear transport factor 2 family protein [Erythrobacter sp. JK5]|uniref:nuclear transport factor 2 family protein n=1 Tax=Erythrobacter sp. JK5 TaxID=2829500 RepID=UPI001BA638AB|nr:nuclear transport factor 2 family protein [Erythrobacter sp. JK5]QUL38801.1 nuclear transport factor 2 family protein [Erythrobacter sp. JK5]
MSEILKLGERLYAALGSSDGETLMELLHPDFRGDTTPGLPFDLGGVYEGRDAMMHDCWGVIGQHFDMHSEVEHLAATDDAIMAYGTYRGTAKSTGKPIAARFAHFWPVYGGRITGVHQTTDSAAWYTALEKDS